MFTCSMRIGLFTIFLFAGTVWAGDVRLGSAQAKAGEAIELELELDQSGHVTGAQFLVDFDAGSLEYHGYQQGTPMEHDLYVRQEQPGRLILVMTRTDGGVSALPNHVRIDLHFETIGLPGIYPIQLSEVVLSDSRAQAIPPGITMGEVQILEDNLAPMLTITGLPEGGHDPHEVTPVITVSDDQQPLPMAVISLNGDAFTSGTTVTEEDHYLLIADVVDNGGRQAHAEARFTIDRSAPSVAVTNIAEGQQFQDAITPVIIVEDLSQFTTTLTLDGMPYVVGNAIEEYGNHVLTIMAKDVHGFQSVLARNFTIAIPAPELLISGVSDGLISPSALTITIQANHGTLTALLDGLPFQSGTTLDSDDDYLLEVTLEGDDGTTLNEQYQFAVDTLAPEILVSGVADGAAYTDPVLPEISHQDAHPGSLTIQLNGQPFTPGTEISEDGDYLLAVNAVDLAGNSSLVELFFSIESDQPLTAAMGVPGRARLLVLIDRAANNPLEWGELDPHGPVTAPTLPDQEQFLLSWFEEQGWAVTLVDNEQDLLDEWRGGTYWATLIFAEAVSLEPATQAELAESVHHGMRLWVAGHQTADLGGLSSTLGLTFQPRVGPFESIYFQDSQVTKEREIFLAFPEEVPAGAAGEAWLMGSYGHGGSYQSGSFLVNHHGWGSSAYLGFDLMAEASHQGLDGEWAEVMAQVLAWLMGHKPTIEPYLAFPLEAGVTANDADRLIRIELELPPGVMVQNPGDFAQVGNILLWENQIGAGSTRTTTAWLVPDSAGLFDFTARVSLDRGQGYQPQETLGLQMDIPANPTRDDARYLIENLGNAYGDVLVALDLAIENHDSGNLHQARTHLLEAVHLMAAFPQPGNEARTARRILGKYLRMLGIEEFNP